MNMPLYEEYSQDQPRVNTGLTTKAEDDDDDQNNRLIWTPQVKKLYSIPDGTRAALAKWFDSLSRHLVKYILEIML